MSAGLEVRPAERADMAAVTAIYAHHVLNGLGTFEEDPPPEAEMARRHDEVLGRGLPYVVAADGGRLLGFAYANIYRPRIAYRYTVEDSVYVAADAARRGVGRLLLGAVIDRCTALGRRQMIAAIGDLGNHGSIGLHRALGFHMVGVLPAAGYKFGRWVDAVLMQRALGPGEAAPPDR